jgi:small multidrug resistance pump
MTTLYAVLIMIFLSGFAVIGDYFLKIAGNGPKYVNYRYFLIGMFVYALCAFGWFFIMKHVKLSTIGVVYSISTVILLALVGFFVFNEQLSLYDIIGIVLGIISILILIRFS